MTNSAKTAISTIKINLGRISPYKKYRRPSMSLMNVLLGTFTKYLACPALSWASIKIKISNKRPALAQSPH